MNTFYELATARESCRNFSEKPVTRELLLKLLEAGRIAPSARNSQPWIYHVADTPETCARLAKCLQNSKINGFLDSCPAFIVIEERDIDPQNPEMTNELQKYGKMDIGIATAQICLQATDLGLSTCIIGLLNQEKLAEALPIKSRYGVGIVIAVGYAATETQRPKKRRALDEMVTFIDD